MPPSASFQTIAALPSISNVDVHRDGAVLAPNPPPLKKIAAEDKEVEFVDRAQQTEATGAEKAQSQVQFAFAGVGFEERAEKQHR